MNNKGRRVRYTLTALLGKPQGANDSFHFKAEMTSELADSGTLTKPVSGEVKLLKLPHEINVQIKDLSTAVRATCIRCTKIFETMLVIPFAAREFVIDSFDRDIGILDDVFYVDMENHEIVLDEMIRQEIVLHFPYNPVCSGGCRGLCRNCGIDLNKTRCDCLEQETKDDRIFPFRGLKA